MTEEINDTPAKSTAPASTRPVSGLLSLSIDALIILVISVVVTALFMKFGAQFVMPTREAPSLAIVNVDQLVQDYITTLNEKVVSGEMKASEMSGKSAEFNKELLTRLAKYADQGTTVLRSDMVIAAPDDVVDITGTLRAEMTTSGHLSATEPKAQPQSK